MDNVIEIMDDLEMTYKPIQITYQYTTRRIVNVKTEARIIFFSNS